MINIMFGILIHSIRKIKKPPSGGLKNTNDEKNFII
jgi:hypothetical protein